MRMVRAGAGGENRGRVLTISQRFEDNPQEFCSAKAYHDCVRFWVGSGEDKEPSLPVRSLCVRWRPVAITPASRHASGSLADMWDAKIQNRQSPTSDRPTRTRSGEERRKKLTKGRLQRFPKNLLRLSISFLPCDRSLSLSRSTANAPSSCPLLPPVLLACPVHLAFCFTSLP